jgi:hypothetical protein
MDIPFFLEPKNSLFCDYHIGMTTIIGISHQDANMRVVFSDESII